jgi:thiol-disulfide isomerase/thioredoxin
MNFKPFSVRLFAVAGAMLAIAASHAQGRIYLNIGDSAPALRPAKWLKGAPVASFQKGRVYVVEFWATWCGPCKENIPHLTELAKKYRDSVSVAGISVWESNDPEDTKYMNKVQKFVGEQGDRMDYLVAVDGPDKKVANAWMKAADESGLPTSFIVGKDGKIAWIGHPANLDTVLAQVVADKFDVTAARARRATEVETTRPIREAMTAKEWRKAIRLMDAAIAKKPEQARFYTYDRLVALFHADPNAAMAEADGIIKESNGDIGAYRMVASIFATYDDLILPVYRYGKKVIGNALEKGEMGYMFLAMSAEVSSHLGDQAGAIKAQEEAVKAAEVDEHAPREFVEFLKKNLERFKTGTKSGK